jgi:hypothetical protein
MFLSIVLTSYGCSKKDICIRCKKGSEEIVICDENVSVAAYQLNSQGYYCVKE